MTFSKSERPARPSLELVAEILAQNTEVVGAYLVVGYRIDGSVAIAHNSCCVPHLINTLVTEIRHNPDLALPRDKYSEDHKS